MNKWIILDRDGVINYDSDEYIKSPDEWHSIPGSLEAITELNQAGYRVIVVTNQSGVGRGLYSEEILKGIHEKMKTELAKLGGHIEDIFYCPHTPTDNCSCRKPKTGLFLAAKNKFNIIPADTFAIGDKLSDIEAARTAGYKPILVLSGKEDAINRVSTIDNLLDIPVFSNLAEAVNFIITNNLNTHV